MTTSEDHPTAIFRTCPVDYDHIKYDKVWERYPQAGLSYLQRHFTIYQARAKQGSPYGNQLIYQSPSRYCHFHLKFAKYLERFINFVGENSISLVLLDADHPLLVQCTPLRHLITRMEIEVNPLVLDNPAKGKRKKGAAKLMPSSQLVTFKVFIKESDKAAERCQSFPICSSLEGSVIEINQCLLEDPTIIFDKFERDAFIGIILPRFEVIQESSILETFFVPPSDSTNTTSQPANHLDYTPEEKATALKENKAQMRKGKKRAITAVERDHDDASAPIIALRSKRHVIDFLETSPEPSQ